MPLFLDPEIAVANGGAPSNGAPPPLGDWARRRAIATAAFEHINSIMPDHDDVMSTVFEVETFDGTTVLATWYDSRAASSAAPGPAAVFFHGGAMILGSVAQYDKTVRAYVASSGVPILAVEYRLAPEFPHPVPVEDCYAGLMWLAARAEEFRVDASRVAVMGDSAGGALAAAVSLMARDRGQPRIARQLLLAPMLDDRDGPENPELETLATFTADDNRTGWRALLGEAAGQAGVSPYAAPARATTLAGLPATYLDVGQVDILCDQGIGFARRLSAAGIEVELHVHPGAPHAFELTAPEADVSRRAVADRVRVLKNL